MPVDLQDELEQRFWFGCFHSCLFEVLWHVICRVQTLSRRMICMSSGVDVTVLSMPVDVEFMLRFGVAGGLGAQVLGVGKRETTQLRPVLASCDVFPGDLELGQTTFFREARLLIHRGIYQHHCCHCHWIDLVGDST